MPELFIRITPYDAVTFEDIEQLLSYLKIERYVVSYEEASRPHYHIYVETKLSVERLRYQIKSKLNCQVYISGKEVQSKVKTIAYTIKDGNFRMKNIDVNEYLMAQRVSHAKPNFDKELKDILSKEWTCSEQRVLTTQVIDLYIKFNRKIYIQHIQSVVRTALSRDKNYKNRLIDRVLESL